MTASDDSATTLVVRKVIPVPRQKVFDAWLDPASIARWMRPGDVVHSTAEVDARVGGKFRIVMSHGKGDGDHWGEYLLIDRPSLLKFTWISANTDLRPTEVTVEFIERGRNTEIVLTHRRVPPDKLTAHLHGWTDIVERLGTTLTSSV